MLCGKCHKNRATVRYAEVVDGKVQDLHLCPACLAKHQDEVGVGFELAKPGPVPSHRREWASAKREPVLSREQCKTCGLALQEVVDSSKVGCSTCYETFAEQIEVLFKGLHAGTRHRGKTPRVDDSRARVRADLQTKRALLRSALRTENYEEAAHLRDEIRVLEKELSPAERKN